MRRWRFILTLILCVLLLTGCFGESVTPYEALQQTDIFALIGHTREEIYQMYLLSDDQVEETEEGTVQLPYDYCPYHEKEPWTRIPWQISLHFIRGKTESREDQIVSGWTLVSVYAGANASIRAKADYNTVGTAFAGTQVQTWIEQSETEEWSYRITMTYQNACSDPFAQGYFREAETPVAKSHRRHNLDLSGGVSGNGAGAGAFRPYFRKEKDSHSQIYQGG